MRLDTRTLALSLILCVAAIAAAAERGPKTHTVIIEGMQFRPEALSVRSGDTIVWVNKDVVAHTATLAGGFDSGIIPPAKSWKSTIRTRGDFAYVCTLHPAMKGTLRVE